MLTIEFLSIFGLFIASISGHSSFCPGYVGSIGIVLAFHAQCTVPDALSQHLSRHGCAGTILLSNFVGPSGSVLASDFAEPMVKSAKARVERHGISNVLLSVADACDLKEIPDASCDHVGSSHDHAYFD